MRAPPAFASFASLAVNPSNYTGANTGTGGPPSVSWNLTFTFMPIFRVFRSQPTKLVSTAGPSFRVT